MVIPGLLSVLNNRNSALNTGLYNLERRSWNVFKRSVKKDAKLSSERNYCYGK